MADRTLFPHPPRAAILVPSTVPRVEPVVRAYWHETFQGAPDLVDSFWSVIPGTKGYCAALEFTWQHDWVPIEGIPEWRLSNQTTLQKRLGRYFLGKRNYGLVFLDDDSDQILAYEFHGLGDSNFYPYEKLRKIEPGIPANPWDFAKSRGVIIERWPEPEPSPPVHKVCIIEGATPDELRPLSHGLDVNFQPVSRGTLVVGSRCSDVGIDAAHKLNKTVYIAKSFPTENHFLCTVFQDGGETAGQFTTWPDEPAYTRLDSVLGETTPRGILRALEVPPELVGLEPNV